VGFSQLKCETDCFVSVPIVQLLNVFPLSNRKLVFQLLSLELHIIFAEEVTGAL
jgi:hypothetical protein